MKSLNLARPQVLIVVGQPGAGKSFFARQFSETFSAPVVSADRIRFELFATPSYSSDENDLVSRIAAYQIEELFKTKKSFIVDGGYNARADRLRLGQLAKKVDYGANVIWIQTDIATSRARALKRSPKRDDDKYNVSLNEELFDGMVRRFTEPTHEGHIVVSGKHTYNTQVKTVLRKLVVAREADADAAHRQEVEQTKQEPRPAGPYRRGITVR
jgi:predicted kinase